MPSNGIEALNNSSVSKQPFVKVHAQLGAATNCPVSQNDRTAIRVPANAIRSRSNYNSAGGRCIRPSSTRCGRSADDAVFRVLQHKGGNDVGYLQHLGRTGPQALVHRLTTLSGGVPSGDGALVTMDNVQSQSLSPSSMIRASGDLTYYQAGWPVAQDPRPGSGPLRLCADGRTCWSTTVTSSTKLRQIDPSNPSGGTVSFHRGTRDRSKTLPRRSRPATSASTAGLLETECATDRQPRGARGVRASVRHVTASNE